ncbi:MAG: hypothetical protein U5N53_12860 [Mycobacterium sp.]|nr:hypothetical protein [Mycobacterium sp.]
MPRVTRCARHAEFSRHGAGSAQQFDQQFAARPVHRWSSPIETADTSARVTGNAEAVDKLVSARRGSVYLNIA